MHVSLSPPRVGHSATVGTERVSRPTADRFAARRPGRTETQEQKRKEMVDAMLAFRDPGSGILEQAIWNMAGKRAEPG